MLTTLLLRHGCTRKRVTFRAEGSLSWVEWLDRVSEAEFLSGPSRTFAPAEPAWFGCLTPASIRSRSALDDARLRQRLLLSGTFTYFVISHRPVMKGTWSASQIHGDLERGALFSDPALAGHRCLLRELQEPAQQSSFMRNTFEEMLRDYRLPEIRGRLLTPDARAC